MADQGNIPQRDQDERGRTDDEQIRGIADEGGEFEDDDEDLDEEDEEGTTF